MEENVKVDDKEKTSMNAEAVKTKTLVEDALSDLEKELNRLIEKRNSLMSGLRTVDKDMEDGQELEKELKGEIMEIEQTEVRLQNDRKKLKNKLDRIQDKLTKVKAIKDDLSHV